MKPQRIVDEKLKAEIRKQRCCACGAAPPSDAEHIKTQGSGGDDVIENLWPLCRPCHVEKGWSLKDFVDKHHHLRFILERKGLFLTEDGKLRKF